MREIKFRFWDKKENRMLTNCPNLALSSNGEVSELKCHDGDNFSGVEWLGSAYSEHIIPLQYTGLKDKNGKEIYEGDIYHQGDKKILYIVVWHDTSLIGKQARASSYAGLSYWKDRIEVIGNIYENSELLEAEL